MTRILGLLVVVFGLLLLVTAQTASAAPPVFNGETALSIAKELDQKFPTRVCGSKEEQSALFWMVEKMSRAGLEVALTTYKFKEGGSASAPSGDQFVAVVGPKGSDPRSVVGSTLILANIDTLKEGGANYNGSGVAVVTTLALNAKNPKHRFGFSTCRNLYETGSRAILSLYGKPEVVVVVDSVGYRGDSDGFYILTNDNPLKEKLRASASVTGVPALAYLNASPTVEYSDHNPFLGAGVPSAAIGWFSDGNTPGFSVPALNVPAGKSGIGDLSAEDLGEIGQWIEAFLSKEHGAPVVAVSPTPQKPVVIEGAQKLDLTRGAPRSGGQKCLPLGGFWPANKARAKDCLNATQLLALPDQELSQWRADTDKWMGFSVQKTKTGFLYRMLVAGGYSRITAWEVLQCLPIFSEEVWGGNRNPYVLNGTPAGTRQGECLSAEDYAKMPLSVAKMWQEDTANGDEKALSPEGFKKLQWEKVFLLPPISGGYARGQ